MWLHLQALDAKTGRVVYDLIGPTKAVLGIDIGNMYIGICGEDICTYIYSDPGWTGNNTQ